MEDGGRSNIWERSLYNVLEAFKSFGVLYSVLLVTVGFLVVATLHAGQAVWLTLVLLTFGVIVLYIAGRCSRNPLLHNLAALLTIAAILYATYRLYLMIEEGLFGNSVAGVWALFPILLGVLAEIAASFLFTVTTK